MQPPANATGATVIMQPADVGTASAVVVRPATPWWSRVAWERYLLWSGFFLLLYALRSFFPVIFLTFLIAYMMRALVYRMSRLISPNQEKPWLERVLTVLSFLLLLACLYGAGSLLVPKLYQQVRSLVDKIGSMRSNSNLNVRTFLGRTVGVYLFKSEYGDQADARFQRAFQEWTAQGPLRTRAFEDFADVISRIEPAFDRAIREEMSRDPAAERTGPPEETFETWFIAERAPALLQQRTEFWVARWETSVKTAKGEAELERMRKSPNFAAVRDQAIFRDILAETKRDSAVRAQARAEWSRRRDDDKLEARKRSPEGLRRLESLFNLVKAQSPDDLPFDFAAYQALRDAHAKGIKPFTEVLAKFDELMGAEAKAGATRPPAAPEKAVSPAATSDGEKQKDFEAEKQAELAARWWEADPLAHSVKESANKMVGETMDGVGKWLREAVPKIISWPLQLGLILLLSFFIVFDFAKIRRGMAKLPASRFGAWYDEIAPEMVTFGKLIGRSFMSQALIALCNTALTFVGMWLLGVQNAVFLSSIVFICSFIPVLGTALSTVPIAMVAIIQPQGNITLAMAAVGMVLMVHFIETSVLNPKIIGDIMHLHPVLVLAVLAIGESVAGLWGLLLAVPLSVYVIRFVIFEDGIPGVIDPPRRRPAAAVVTL